MIIGLTGTNASGKTSVLNYLISKGFEAHSLSDIIRKDIEDRGDEPSRDNLIRVGNELREKFGASILADRIKTQMSSTKVVIDSIRNPAEINSLRMLYGFYLIAMDAPVEIRFERAKARGRIENVFSLEEFIKMENKEKSNVDNHQNITTCMALTDRNIFNSGNIEQLQKQIDNILNELQNRSRPSWEQYFMKMAFLVAERSTCLRHHIGAIIVKDRHVLTTGYNGAARNTDDCLKLGCLRDQLNIASGERHEICRAVHAEQNAIIQAGVHGANIEGGTLYCTHNPCIICAKMIVNAGIIKVVTCDSYPDDFNLVIDLFKEAKVEFAKINRPGMLINILP